MPLEVRNIEVARSLGILDEVNRMKVLPGASPSSSMVNKNVRYMENSKMLPPSKRFKMENSVPVHQNGIEIPKTGVTSAPVAPVTSVTSTSVTPSTPTQIKSCSVSVAPVVPAESSAADSTSSSSSDKTSSTQAPPPAVPMEVTPSEDEGKKAVQTSPRVESLHQNQDQVESSSDSKDQAKEQKKDTSPAQTITDSKTPEASSAQTPESSSAQTPESSSVQTQKDSSQPEPKELQEGQEIYIQTEGMTVQLAEPGLDRIVIVNGPDGTTMHIQTPEGVPLEAVQALLGIEASDGAKAPQ